MLLMFPCCSFTLWDLFLVIGLLLIGMVVFSCLVGVIAGALIPGASKLGGGLLGLLFGATAVGLAVLAAFAGLGGADDGGWSLAVLAMIFYGVGALLTVSVQLLLWGLRRLGTGVRIGAPAVTIWVLVATFAIMNVLGWSPVACTG